MTLSRRTFTLGATLATTLGPAFAQDKWPSKPITYLVPFPAGGTTDVLARLTSSLAAGDILLLHDGHAARTARGAPVLLEVLPGLLQRFARSGLSAVTLTQAMPHAMRTETPA